jgi:hypothetical protein
MELHTRGRTYIQLRGAFPAHHVFRALFPGGRGHPPQGVGARFGGYARRGQGPGHDGRNQGGGPRGLCWPRSPELLPGRNQKALAAAWTLPRGREERPDLAVGQLKRSRARRFEGMGGQAERAQGSGAVACRRARAASSRRCGPAQLVRRAFGSRSRLRMLGLDRPCFRRRRQVPRRLTAFTLLNVSGLKLGQVAVEMVSHLALSGFSGPEKQRPQAKAVPWLIWMCSPCVHARVVVLGHRPSLGRC